MLKRYAIVLEDKEVDKIDEIAEEQERSRSFLVRRAIKKFLRGGCNEKRGRAKATV